MADQKEITGLLHEELTWREGRKYLVDTQIHGLSLQIQGLNTLFDTHVNAIYERVLLLKEALAASIANTDMKAQNANNELERLLEAHIVALSAMATQRLESTTVGIVKVEQQLTIALDAAQNSLASVDQRSQMLHDSALTLMHATENTLLNRILSLQQMIELRSEMNQTAILKAEQANERRFDSVNEFRQTLTDQATNFVSRSILEARIAQVDSSCVALSERIRTNTEQGLSARNELATRVASLEGKLYIGGAGIVIIIAVLQLVINYLHQ